MSVNNTTSTPPPPVDRRVLTISVRTTTKVRLGDDQDNTQQQQQQRQPCHKTTELVSVLASPDGSPLFTSVATMLDVLTYLHKTEHPTIRIVWDALQDFLEAESGRTVSC